MTTTLSSQGLVIDLPQGWEAHIYRRRETAGAAGAAGAAGTAGAGSGAGGANTNAVLHAANFPLPPERGDFGGGAVETMSIDHALVVLVEYDRASATTPLFAQKGPPVSLDTSAFRPDALQRTIPGQAGTQVFFNAGGRAFCLYVVLGNHRNVDQVLPAVNAVLRAITVTAAGPS
jgi:hypothetical protein